VLTVAAIAVTLIASLLTGTTAMAALRDHLVAGRWLRAWEPLIFIVLVMILVYGGLVYQLARLGYFSRLQRHIPAPDTALTAWRSRADIPWLTILVPAYRESVTVVRKTLLSAALLDYPHRHVVLLIDDPPYPNTASDEEALRDIRALVTDIRTLLNGPRQVVLDAWAPFQQRRRAAPFDVHTETTALSKAYAAVAEWLRRQARDYPCSDHTDRLFVNVTLSEPAARYRARSKELTQSTVSVTPDSVAAEYRHLINRFTGALTSFERKRYGNMSHEPNKAMNLNSYLAIMGGHFREEAMADGLRLARVTAPGPDVLTVLDSDYVLVLDADSILRPDYAVRLIHFLEQPENHRVAVAQTPYTAFPGTSPSLEHVAGATTDIQYLLHQGFTFYGATFWVGANAIVRKKALEAVVQRRVERGFEIPIFIQDRTVIEDTESSIDLVAAGWSLYNYPERMAYSATPPDFGSLLIQRRRWANGGLIIVPKLLRLLRHGWRRPHRVMEAFFRLHYLTSLAGASLAVLVLLGLSFDRELLSMWLPLSAAPYYALYGRDLRQAGYGFSDLPRVYALNLMLLPINLAGVLQSVRQICTGKKSAFGRTPKIQGRTAAAPAYVLAEYGLLALWLLGAALELVQGRSLNAVLAIANVLFLYYAVHAFIGHRNAYEDVRGVIWASRRACSVLIARRGRNSTDYRYKGRSAARVRRASRRSGGVVMACRQLATWSSRKTGPLSRSSVSSE
jgi:cellulose synthase (UDP-forming)